MSFCIPTRQVRSNQVRHTITYWLFRPVIAVLRHQPLTLLDQRSQVHRNLTYARCALADKTPDYPEGFVSDTCVVDVLRGHACNSSVTHGFNTSGKMLITALSFMTLIVKSTARSR